VILLDPPVRANRMVPAFLQPMSCIQGSTQSQLQIRVVADGYDQMLGIMPRERDGARPSYLT
jgi:hypothetical protein